MPTVLITGANRGIGLALTTVYADQGATVHACCRTPDNAGDLKAIKGDVTVHGLDTTDNAALNTLASSLSGPIDILIANAGVYGKPDADQTFAGMDPDGLRFTLEVNFIATLMTIKAFLPHLRQATDAKAVAITSKMGSITDASGGSVAYRSSKTALNMAMAVGAQELCSDGIALATLHPGWVRTDMGGPNGLISAEDSAAGLAEVISSLKPCEKAPFLDYAGKTIPW